jgi:SAM-dependent methyltransferase
VQRQLGVESDIEKWTIFNEKLQTQTAGKIPQPFAPVEKLTLKYLQKPCLALDIGCETGKNSAYLIRNGHQVIILDIAPNAVQYTKENLKQEGLDHGVADSVVSGIEDLSPKYGPFKAVIGTYALSFIPPHLFEQTMKDCVLGRIEHNGYFAGGFFGEQHGWAVNPNLSVLDVKKLESLFASLGFSILEIDEQIKECPTVSNGITKFHTINLIAHKTLPIQQ